MKKVMFLVFVLVGLAACSDNEIAEMEQPNRLLSSLELQEFVSSQTNYTTYSSRDEAEGVIAKERDLTVERGSCGQFFGDGTGWVAYQSASGDYKLYAWDDNTNTHTIMTITPSEYDTFCNL